MTIRIRENLELVTRVRASLLKHPLSEQIRRFAAERNRDESQLHDLVAESVIDALDELGTAYSAEMTSVVEHMTEVRAEVHEVYERALSGTIDPSDPAVLRNLMSQLHDDMGRLADPEAWAKRQATEPLTAKRSAPQPAPAEPATTEPDPAGPAGTGEAAPTGRTARRRRLKDLPPDARARVEQLRQAADAAAASTRRAPREPDGLPPGWDYAKYPYGPRGGWQPGDSVNIPDGAGNHPAWDTIRKRIWRTKATDELAGRSAATSKPVDRLIALDPIEMLTDEELQKVAKTGVIPERAGAEIEHKRIPQRMGRLLQEAGLDASEARELTKLGDPSNLEPTVKEWHAVVDQRAREINPNRNRLLRLSLDERVEFPFGSASNEELAAIVDRLRERSVDLDASPAGRALRDILRREKERRGAWARWTVP